MKGRGVGGYPRGKHTVLHFPFKIFFFSFYHLTSRLIFSPLFFCACFYSTFQMQFQHHTYQRSWMSEEHTVFPHILALYSVLREFKSLLFELREKTWGKPQPFFFHLPSFRKFILRFIQLLLLFSFGLTLLILT